MKTSQYIKIINYLEKNGSITPIDAFRYLGITKLATRISEMSKDGYIFDREWETSDSSGEQVRYMRYRLKEAPHE